MSPLPYLVVLAAAGGHVNFTGAVVTPTAQSVAPVVQGMQRGLQGLASHSARLEGPPRALKIRPPRQTGGAIEVVVTYL